MGVRIYEGYVTSYLAGSSEPSSKSTHSSEPHRSYLGSGERRREYPVGGSDLSLAASATGVGDRGAERGGF